MANQSSRIEQPVRLPNPTAESFIQALKVVRFFAVVLFWVALIVILVQLAAFVVTEWVGWFDADGGNRAEAPLAGEYSGIPAVAVPSKVHAATGIDEPASPRDPAEVRYACAEVVLNPVRTVGIMASVLLWATLFLYLQIALLGRLSGIKQLTVSVFLTLLFLASALPWSALLKEVNMGSCFRFADLVQAHRDTQGASYAEAIRYYLRFFVTTLISLFLLVGSWANFASGYEESVLLNE